MPRKCGALLLLPNIKRAISFSYRRTLKGGLQHNVVFGPIPRCA